MYRSRRRDLRKQRRSRVASTLALLVVLAGLGLVAYALLGENSPLEKAISNAAKDEKAVDSAPKETTLKLTVPKMERVRDINVVDAPYDDESALDDGAQHIQDTGFPWEEGSNVYIAGHRLGYLGTDSYLVFWDLDKVEEGDEIYLTDSDGTRYTYEVFTNFVADPYDWSVTEPVPGKSIVTLQTCTLPDYTERLIVQGELTKVEPGEGAESTNGDKTTQEETEPAPVDQAPADQAPVDQTPVVDQAPADEAPIVDQAPVEPAPVNPVPAEPVPVPAGPVPRNEPPPAGPAQEAQPPPAQPAPAPPVPTG
jgi:sortase A